jgi:hypothetical protein
MKGSVPSGANLPQRLKLIKVEMNKIFLDPNNPRLIELGVKSGVVPEKRITEKEIQENLLNELSSSTVLDVKSLKDSILQVGFLPMDKVVVRKIVGEADSYVVVEGNRRIAAIKWILRDHMTGELTLKDEFVNQLSRIDVLELETDPQTSRLDQFILQGIRHISGIKQWGPYQQSEAAIILLEMGKNPREIAQALGGLSVTRVNRLIRANRALTLMREDEEYGEYATSEMFSYFEELISQPYLRDTWLKWSDKEGKFKDEANTKLIYSWITPNEDLNGAKKIPMAIDLRDLPGILQDKYIFDLFLKPTVTIDHARAALISARAPMASIDWRKELQSAVFVLSSGITFGEFDEDDLKLLTTIVQLCNKRIEQIKKLMKAA